MSVSGLIKAVAAYCCLLGVKEDIHAQCSSSARDPGPHSVNLSALSTCCPPETPAGDTLAGVTIMAAGIFAHSAHIQRTLTIRLLCKGADTLLIVRQIVPGGCDSLCPAGFGQALSASSSTCQRKHLHDLRATCPEVDARKRVV